MLLRGVCGLSNLPIARANGVLTSICNSDAANAVCHFDTGMRTTAEAGAANDGLLHLLPPFSLSEQTETTVRVALDILQLHSNMPTKTLKSTTCQSHLHSGQLGGELAGWRRNFARDSFPRSCCSAALGGNNLPATQSREGYAARLLDIRARSRIPCKLGAHHLDRHRLLRVGKPSVRVGPVHTGFVLLELRCSQWDILGKGSYLYSQLESHTLES